MLTITAPAHGRARTCRQVCASAAFATQAILPPKNTPCSATWPDSLACALAWRLQTTNPCIQTIPTHGTLTSTRPLRNRAACSSSWSGMRGTVSGRSLDSGNSCRWSVHVALHVFHRSLALPPTMRLENHSLNVDAVLLATEAGVCCHSLSLLSVSWLCLHDQSLLLRLRSSIAPQGPRPSDTSRHTVTS